MIPVKADGTKAPPVAWSDYQSRRASDEEIEKWFSDTSHGIACVCGLVSGGLEFLDFETEDAYEDFEDAAGRAGLRALLCKIEEGYYERAPRGGFHLAYRCTAPVEGSHKLAQAKNNGPADQQIKTLIETRGEGSYCIVSPSNGTVHPSGKPYVLLEGGLDSIVTITPEERQELLDIGRNLDEVPPRAEAIGGTPTTSKAEFNRPGDNFNQHASWVEVLGPHGWSHVYDRDDGTACWRRPEKPVGISATTNYGGADRLYVFSTSTPFETNCLYDKFAARAVLEHDGDLKATARQLRKEGYGSSEDGADPLPESQKSRWPKPLGEAAFHGLVGRIVRTIDPHTEADPAALLVQLLVAVGNALGRTAHFIAEADRHAFNLFTVLVGQTAKGRKGSSWGWIPRLFETVNAQKPGGLRNTTSVGQSLNVASGLSSGEGLIWAVRDPVSEKDEGVLDKRLVVLESEFASTLRVVGRDGNTLSALIRTAWDTGDLRSLTKNSPAQATGAHISIIGHITRDELLRELTRTEAGNGFANRFLWICVRRSKVLPEGGALNADELRPLGGELAEVLKFGQAVGEMKRDEASRVLWCEVYESLSDGQPGLFGAVIARAEAQVMRLAGIYALMDRSDVICVQHLGAALEVWRYAEDSARFVFGDALGDPVADEILGALRTHPEGLTRSDIRDLFSRNAKAVTISAALALLDERSLAHCHS